MIYILIITLFLIDLYLFILGPIFERKSNVKELEKRQKSQQKIEYQTGYIIIENYPRKCLIEISNIYNLELDIPYVNLKNRVSLNNLSLINVKKIYQFNAIVNNLELISKRYSVKNGAIYDKGKLLYFYQNKNKADLIRHALEDDIKRRAIKYFSNAPYVQFSKKMAEIRISKPYYEKNEHAYLITPSKINGVKIKQISINLSDIDYLYISPTVRRVILEKKSKYLEIKNDSKNFKIRYNGLVKRFNNTYVNFKNDVFSKYEESFNGIKYEPKYRLKKYRGKIKCNVNLEKFKL